MIFFFFFFVLEKWIQWFFRLMQIVIGYVGSGQLWVWFQF